MPALAAGAANADSQRHTYRCDDTLRRTRIRARSVGRIGRGSVGRICNEFVRRIGDGFVLLVVEQARIDVLHAPAGALVLAERPLDGALAAVEAERLGDVGIDRRL